MHVTLTRLKEYSTFALAKLSPYLRIAKKAAEHVPTNKDGPIAVVVKCMAILDAMREEGGKDTGYWRRLQDERSLAEQESETFVALFFGTALRDAYTIKRKSITDRVDLLEADIGNGQSIIFREERWSDKGRLSEEFLLSKGANTDSMIERLWASYPHGIYVSVAVNEYGYNRTTSIAEITVPKMHFLSSAAKSLLADTIDTQYRVAHAGQHRSYLLYGKAGTGKSSFAVGFAKGCGGRVLQFDSTALPLIGVKELGFLLDTLKPSALILNDIDRAPVEKIGPRLLYLFEYLKAKHPEVPLVLTVNDASKLDSALLRPGRIEKAIEFKLPDREEREELIEALTQCYNVDLSRLAMAEIVDGTEGLSHAYVSHLVEAMVHEDPMIVLADMRRLRALAEPVKAVESKDAAVKAAAEACASMPKASS